MCELIGARIQFVISKLFVSANQGNRVGGRFDLRLKQLMNTLPNRKLNPCVVKRDEQLMLLSFSQQPQLGKPSIWIRPYALEQNLVVTEQAFDRARCKEIAVIFKAARQATYVLAHVKR